MTRYQNSFNTEKKLIENRDKMLENISKLISNKKYNLKMAQSFKNNKWELIINIYHE